MIVSKLFNPIQVPNRRHIRRGDTIRSDFESAHYENMKTLMEQCYVTQGEEFCLKWRDRNFKARTIFFDFQNAGR